MKFRVRESRIILRPTPDRSTYSGRYSRLHYETASNIFYLVSILDSSPSRVLSLFIFSSLYFLHPEISTVSLLFNFYLPQSLSPAISTQYFPSPFLRPETHFRLFPTKSFPGLFCAFP